MPQPSEILDVYALDPHVMTHAVFACYLDVNCAQCHRPDGGTTVALDLRFDTPLEATNTVGVVPQASTLGDDARIIAPGARSESVLWERMRRLDASRMPPLTSHRVDDAGVELIGAWIDGL